MVVPEIMKRLAPSMALPMRTPIIAGVLRLPLSTGQTAMSTMTPMMLLEVSLTIPMVGRRHCQ